MGDQERLWVNPFWGQSAPTIVSVGTEPDIYATGFEDGTSGRFTDDVNVSLPNSRVTTDQAYRGTRSLKFSYGTTTGGSDGSGGRAYYGFFIHGPKPAAVWHRAAYRWTDVPTAIQKVERWVGQGGSVGMGTITYQGQAGGSKKLKWFWDNFASRSGTNIGSVIVADRWYLVETHFDTVGASSKLHVTILIDGEQVLDQDSDFNNDGNNKISHIIHDGTLNQGNTVPFTMYLDGFGLSSQQMGVPA